jgi:hypothetical protein
MRRWAHYFITRFANQIANQLRDTGRHRTSQGRTVRRKMANRNGTVSLELEKARITPARR